MHVEGLLGISSSQSQPSEKIGSSTTCPTSELPSIAPELMTRSGRRVTAKKRAGEEKPLQTQNQGRGSFTGAKGRKGQSSNKGPKGSLKLGDSKVTSRGRTMKTKPNARQSQVPIVTMSSANGGCSPTNQQVRGPIYISSGLF